MDVLPLDICNLIVKKLKLDPIARIRLGSVSHLWRQLTKQFEDKEKTPMFPWVMLHEKPPMFRRVMLHHPLDSHAQDFMSMEDGYVMKLKFPRITTSPGAIHEYRCGPSNKKGWLVWQILTKVGEQDLYPCHLAIHLWFINPLASAKIELPIINQIAHEPSCTPLGQRFSIKKAIFSSDPCATDCVVAAIDKCAGMVYFGRLGEPSWTSFCEKRIHDIVFYKGRFLGYDDSRGRFVVFEYDHINQSVNGMVYKAPLPRHERGYIYSTYMLESCGDVLLVVKKMPNHPEPGTGDHSGLEPSFQVFKLKVGLSNYNLVKMDSLGDTILFVGYHASMSVSAKDFPTKNLKGNCIHFINHVRSCERCINFGVYHLEDGRVEPIFPSETHLFNAKSPLFWLKIN